MKDGRVRVEVRDALETLRESAAGFDAILLDVDHGPAAFTNARNAALYGDAGQRLKYAGFDVSVERVRARLKKGGPRHTIFLGRVRG